MRRTRFAAGLTTAVGVLVACGALADGDPPQRILSIGGSVTEIVYALGEADRLVARDTTSSWPAAAELLPDVGYMRALSPEGVLSVGPDLIIAEDGAGPPETIAVLASASVPMVTVPESYSREGIVEKVVAVADALGVSDKGAALSQQLETDLRTAEADAKARNMSTKRVLFVLSTQGGRIMASGTGTAADGIIRMSGGVNAIDSFDGYKPLTDEAVTLAAPDVILMMDRVGDHAMPDDALFALPAFRATPAAATGAVVRMDGLLLLGFGPRTAEAITTLSTRLAGG